MGGLRIAKSGCLPFIIGLVLAVICLVVAVAQLQNLLNAPSEDQRALQWEHDNQQWQAAFDQQERDRGRWNALADNMLAPLTLAGWLVIVAAPTTGLIMGGVYVWNRRESLVRFNLTEPVVGRTQVLQDGNLVYSVLSTHQTAAMSQPRYPALTHMTYSPHNERTYEGGEGQADLDTETLDPDVVFPRFSELIDQGTFQPNGQILMGFNPMGAPVWRGLKDLFSALVPGGPGTGKTWTVVQLICWLLLNGAEVGIIDPHAGDDESLTNRLKPLQPFLMGRGTAGDPDSAVKLLTHFKQRMLLRRNNIDPARHLLVLVVDEYAGVMNPNDIWAKSCGVLLANVLEMTGYQFRKYRVVTICATQNVKATRTGGTETREAFAFRLIHSLHDKQLPMLGLEDEEKDQVASLGRSMYLLKPTMGEGEIVRAPEITMADVGRVAEVIGPLRQLSAARAAPPPPQEQVTRSFEPSSAAIETYNIWRRVKSGSRTVAEQFNVSTSAGHKYQDYLKIVDGRIDEVVAAQEGKLPDPAVQQKRQELERKYGLSATV
jgi:hypothetical protein